MRLFDQENRRRLGVLPPRYVLNNARTRAVLPLLLAAALAAPARAEDCRGYRLERTSGADWAAGTSVESADLELAVAYDTAEAIRVTWPQVAASVTVTSDRGDGFGAVELRHARTKPQNRLASASQF